MARVIAVSNLKGGIGKTTTVVNVGAGLALKGARVLLVDTDAQGNLGMALGVKPNRTLYEILVDRKPPAQCTITARPNLDLIAADHTLLAAQALIAQRSDWSRVLEQGLRPLYSTYDFILIDSGGSLTLLNTNALMCASDVIVPTTIEHFSIQSVELLFSQIARLKGHANSIRMIVPTMFDPRVRQSGELLTDLRARYGQLIAPPVRVNVRLSEAPAQGKTIYEYDARSRGAVDYATLVEHISSVFGYEARPAQKPAKPAAAEPVAPQRITPDAVAPRPAPLATNGHSLQPSSTCPHCGRALQYATLAGYRVGYCDHCKYKVQTLVQSPRR